VLHRHGGVEVGGYDVFLNAVGGVRIDEPAVDLAALLAIDSSFKNRRAPRETRRVRGGRSRRRDPAGAAGQERLKGGVEARLPDGAVPGREPSEAGHPGT
jgi:DNA repair protein RadA/Sms